MKKGLLALTGLACALVLASCGNDSASTMKTGETTTKETTTKNTTTTTTSSTNEEKYYDGYEYRTLDEIKSSLDKNTNTSFYGFTMSSFTNLLPKPNTALEVDEFEELIDKTSNILDYCAFYHLDEIQITYPKKYLDLYLNENDLLGEYVNQIINMGYWNSRLLVSVVNFTFECDDNNTATINFIYNEEANQYKTKEEDSLAPTTIPYTFYSTVGHRSSDNTVFGYQSYTNGTVDVYNSDQLVYALENKYIPNCLAGSPAERVFNQAKNVLNNIIYDDMTLLDKEIAINSWILSHATYAPSEEYATFVKDDTHPDEIISMLQGVYVEGILDAHEGVCHGFAKTLSLLNSIEGIENVKVSAPNQAIDMSETINSIMKMANGVVSYQSHGYVYIKDPNTEKYYINDPTYSYFSTYGNHYLYRNQAIMMDYGTWKNVYQDQARDIFSILRSQEMAQEGMNYKERFIMKANGVTMNLAPSTIEEVDTLIANIQDYVSNYNDSNYKYSNYMTLNIYPADSIFSEATSKFDNSSLNIPYIIYASLYRDHSFGIDF